MIVIKVTGGLCNRLRAVFSYFLKAKDDKTNLLVIWISDKYCNGYFENYFKFVI